MLRAEMKLTRAPRGAIETMVSNVGVGKRVHQFRDKVPFVLEAPLYFTTKRDGYRRQVDTRNDNYDDVF
jgi:hypothetical protein